MTNDRVPADALDEGIFVRGCPSDRRGKKKLDEANKS
jgi:hypothetical protein